MKRQYTYQQRDGKITDRTEAEIINVKSYRRKRAKNSTPTREEH